MVNGTIRVKEIVYRTHGAVRGRMATSFPPTMSDPMAGFREIAEKLGSLSNELKECTEPSKRLALLRQFRSLLADADMAIAGESEAD